MKALICPECGGQITDYLPGATFATCGYCSTKFLIQDTKPQSPSGEASGAKNAQDNSSGSFVPVVTGVLIAIVVVAVLSLSKSNKLPPASSLARSSPSPSSVPTPDPATLRFGGAGTSNGQFQKASSIAVDQQGRIYISDGQMRVQQFEPSGNFLKVLTVPARGANYRGASDVDKIEVGDDGRLFVAVGGVILVYTDNWAAPPRVIQVAPDYIHDFQVKHDGSMLAVSVGEDDRDEYLLFVNKNGGITKRIQAFHSKALNSPSTSSELVRIAVDAKGDIFSVYALGPFSGMAFNKEHREIAEFTPDGKFVRSLLPDNNAKSLLIGPGDRLYIASPDAVTAYDLEGKPVSDTLNTDKLNAFAVDKNGLVYIASDNGVAKYPAIGH